MDRKQIGVYAGKVWQLLSNNEKWCLPDSSLSWQSYP